MVGLAFDAEVHDVITADGAVVDDDVPSPESNGVPLPRCEQLLLGGKLGAAHLLDLEALLVALGARTSLCRLRLRGGSIRHVHVGHGEDGGGVQGGGCGELSGKRRRA